MAFERIINIPKRGIGKITLSKISAIARINNTSMFEAAELFIQNLSTKVNYEISEFIFKVSKWSKLKNEMSHIELTQLILEDSKYIEYLEQEEKNS